MPDHHNDIKETAIATPFGLWEFLRMLLKLCDAGQSFRRLMTSVLQELPSTFVYIDNVLVTSRDGDDHLYHLKAFLNSCPCIAWSSIHRSVSLGIQSIHVIKLGWLIMKKYHNNLPHLFGHPSLSWDTKMDPFHILGRNHQEWQSHTRCTYLAKVFLIPGKSLSWKSTPPCFLKTTPNPVKLQLV